MGFPGASPRAETREGSRHGPFSTEAKVLPADGFGSLHLAKQASASQIPRAAPCFLETSSRTHVPGGSRCPGRVTCAEEDVSQEWVGIGDYHYPAWGTAGVTGTVATPSTLARISTLSLVPFLHFKFEAHCHRPWAGARRLSRSGVGTSSVFLLLPTPGHPPSLGIRATVSFRSFFH